MLRVPIIQARSGMELAMPIFHPRRADTILLKVGVSLDGRVIGRLREQGIREIWIRYPGLEFLEEVVSPDVAAAHMRITKHIAETFDEVARDQNARLEFSEYRRAISGLLDKLSQSPKAALFIEEIVDHSRPALRHASNVCLISVLMGLVLEDYLVHERRRLSSARAKDVTNLGVGAMLHDLGMLRLDVPTLERWNQTHDESDQQWRRHVWIGHRMVRGQIDPTAAGILLHHHQKYDGSGFPSRSRLDGGRHALIGSEIHVFARIAAAADLFDRLRNPAHAPGAPVQGSIPVVRALGLLRESPYRDWIDPVVFRALLAVVPPYPPGTIVTLSNGMRAAVVSFSGSEPCRPVVQRLGDEGFDVPRGKPERIDLREATELRVVEAQGVDVSQDNFFSRSPGEFDVKATMRSLFNAAPRAGSESARLLPVPADGAPDAPLDGL